MTDGKGTPTMDERTRNTLDMLNEAIAAHTEDGTEGSVLCQRLTAKRDEILGGKRVAGQRPASDQRDSQSTTSGPTQYQAGDSDVRLPQITKGRPANENQTNYIGRLLNERILPDRSARGGMLAHVDLYHQNALSSSSASQLIDWLKSLPTRTNARMATPRQLSSVIREGERRDYRDASVERTVTRATAGEEITFAEASRALDVLFAASFLPRDRQPATGSDAQDELPAGMYRTDDGTIFKVQRAVHGSGRMYAKRLVVATEAVRDEDGHIAEAAQVSFEYDAGAIRQLDVSNRMSLDEAKAFGALYGTCCQCGRTLTDERSIEMGIGRVCAGKDMWA